MWNIIFLITGALFLVLLVIIFVTKKTVDSKENQLFKTLILINGIEYLFEIPLQLFVRNIGIEAGIVTFLSKLYLVSIFTWFTFFSNYTFIISIDKSDNENYEKKYNIYRKINYVFWIIGIICFMIVPFSKFHEGDNMYIYGGAVDLLKAFLAVDMVIWISFLIKNAKSLRDKKYVPMFAILVLLVLNVVIQSTNPSILIATMIGTFIVYTMFFTIENPDARLVELEKREKELAMSANEAKTAFLSSMSHEIRTPLNAIVGLSEDMLSYQDKVPSEVKEDCDDIVNASNTLLEIIGNILDISKIEGGKLELIESDYLPKEEIESLLKIMRTKVEEKELQFNVYIDPNIPECLYGDRLRIKQIINNFLSNAIKYTEKGSIDFGARWINNSLELKVRDTGRGIKKEDMDKLFEKFERLHVEKTSAVQGTGLGLAITKNLINLMGGTIHVDSEFGVGSTFDVIIPQKIGNKDNIVREALSVEEKHNADFTGKKLLVVDDNKLNIKVLRKAILSFNFDVDECYNGEEALKKIGEKSYDLILMDIMMPVMGGEETLGILKQNPEFKTPVLALTADATTGAKEKYLAAGFVDYLTKPFSRDTIAKKLEKALEDTK